MIIACPACLTRYAVPDTMIGVEGRTVRCAKCRHSWFQEGPELAPMAEPAVPPPPPPPPPAPDETGPAAPAPEADPPPLAEVRAPRVFAEPELAYAEADAGSAFDYEPPFRPRRNWARIGMVAAVAFALTAFAAIGAVAWYGLPGWMPLGRPEVVAHKPDLVLDFPPNRQDRRTLANGTEFFGASGTVTNVGKERRVVPPIVIVLRDAGNRIVYTLEVTSPKASLAPGESESINEAVTDVPKSARAAEIGWKPE
ncbi:MAG: zinc-ribbon domain-containing protein [Proteobacteria bacterium]|nr:zinc-ribbon domain-containing protein [Pseudomonadota bacterium]